MQSKGIRFAPAPMLTATGFDVSVLGIVTRSLGIHDGYCHMTVRPLAKNASVACVIRRKGQLKES